MRSVANVEGVGEMKLIFVDAEGKVVKEVAKANAANINVKSFVRFETGEGIEKKQEDFAAEVAAMAGNK